MAGRSVWKLWPSSRRRSGRIIVRSMYFLEDKDFRHRRVDKMARRQIFLRVRRFSSRIIIPPVIRIHVFSYQRHTAHKSFNS